MSTVEICQEIRDLPKVDKLQILQVLVSELAKDEDIPSAPNYPLWPIESIIQPDILLENIEENTETQVVELDTPYF